MPCTTVLVPPLLYSCIICPRIALAIFTPILQWQFRNILGSTNMLRSFSSSALFSLYAHILFLSSLLFISKLMTVFITFNLHYISYTLFCNIIQIFLTNNSVFSILAIPHAQSMKFINDNKDTSSLSTGVANKNVKDDS